MLATQGTCVASPERPRGARACDARTERPKRAGSHALGDAVARPPDGVDLPSLARSALRAQHPLGYSRGVPRRARLKESYTLTEHGSNVGPGLTGWLMQDWKANAGRYWVQLFLVWFRLAQWANAHLGAISPLIVTPYWLLTSLVLGVEFPATVTIGSGLQIFHLHGIVLHPRTRIGVNCQMRHGVTIGNRVDRAGAEIGAATIGDHVDLGAGCAIIGNLHVGDHARVGALSVVLKSVPEWGVMVGNPARLAKIDASTASER